MALSNFQGGNGSIHPYKIANWAEIYSLKPQIALHDRVLTNVLFHVLPHTLDIAYPFWLIPDLARCVWLLYYSIIWWVNS